MFNLIVRDIKNYRDEFPIDNQVVVVGRGDNIHIQINSNKISRKQFRIISKGLKLYIEDLNSANGTFVNDERIDKITVITENDVIQFGDLYAQLNNTNKIKKNFKIDDIVEALIIERDKRLEKPYYRLVSKDKRYPGLIFEMEEGITTLGRTSASNIVIPDQTLSKKHLRFNRKRDKLFIEDLNSYNGTKIAGRKLREKKQVFDGDKIEIGDVKFTISSNIEIKKDNSEKKKKLIIIASIFIVILLLIVVFRPKKEVKKKVIKVTTFEDDVVNKEKEMNLTLAKAQKYAIKADWDKAIEYCEKVLATDPANTNAQNYKTSYINEKKYKKFFIQGKEAFDLLNYEDAMTFFKQIPKNTFYREKARLHVREAKEELKKKYFAEAKVFYKSRHYLDTYASLKKLFNVSAYHSGGMDLKAKVEKKMKRARIKFKKFDIKLNDIHVANTGNVKSKIKKIYPAKEIATPLEYYVNGDIEYAIKYLNKISVTNKYYIKIKPFLKTIKLIKAKYALGNGWIIKKDYPKARMEWDKVLRLDKSLLKGIDVESKYSQMIKNHLSEGFYELGKKAYRARMYKAAFIKLTESLKYNPQNTYTLSELSKIKKRAERLWTESLQLEKAGNKKAFNNWNEIINMTAEKDELHKKALDKLNNAAE